MDALIRRQLESEMLKSYDSLRSFAISLTGNVDRAEDLVQETLLRAISHLDSFQPGTNMQAWLFAILRNFFNSQYRKLRREVEDPDGDIAEAVGSVAANQLEAIEWNESRDKAKALLKRVRRIIAGLPVVQRNAFWLVHAEGHSYDEAAAIQDVPVGTIKSRVSRALHYILDAAKKRGLQAEGFEPEHWSAAFEGLSPIVAREGVRRVRRSSDAPDFVFAGLPCELIETLRLGRGPATQIFRVLV